ncbi:hypothetical protein ADK70_12765 [Streptomyces rimosus subsp. pseudoverticillatus]|uniref:hypothetical protein n=1 Tax=Streptomyces rimosus TaxID=1927 RepID=UPI0006B29C4D|nr:hypothetical protein [Streptomyces rimosus]KOT94535.1 hypothetical protein ADK70_12765 [Streptomyces rimosus subsp. pseudoverticillatus]
MSARDNIANLLWWSVPSSDDAEAKAITADLLDRYRAEVLREAADAVAPDAFGYGGPDHDDAWSAAEEKLRRMADAAEAGESRA